MYEDELAQARKALDELAKEKAQLQIDAGKYRAEADDWLAKLVVVSIYSLEMSLEA